jgi:hypothetical protein
MTLAQTIKTILAARPEFKRSGSWLNSLVQIWDLDKDYETQPNETKAVVRAWIAGG